MSYFVKQISLQDLAGASMMPDRRFFGIMGRVSKTNEWLRPQLLGRVVIFNAPSWAKLAFRIASNFISQKTLSKVWIHRQTPLSFRDTGGSRRHRRHAENPSRDQGPYRAKPVVLIGPVEPAERV